MCRKSFRFLALTVAVTATLVCADEFKARAQSEDPLSGDLIIRALRQMEALAPNADEYWSLLMASVDGSINKGNYEKGIIVAQEGRRYAEQNFAPNDRRANAILNRLALLYKHTNRYADSALLYTEAYQGSMTAFGEAHPDTLANLMGIGSVRALEGFQAEAEDLLAKAVRIGRERLGEEHEMTLTSLNQLGWFYEAQGRYGEAEPLFVKAYEVRIRVLGKTHEHTLISLNNLAALYHSQKRYDKAEPLYRKALELRRDTLGAGHYDTLLSHLNLATLYLHQQRYADAEALSSEALIQAVQNLGADHPLTLAVANGLAGALDHQGRYQEAEELFRRVMTAKLRFLGERHPSTLVALNNVAAHLHQQGRHEEAKALYEQAEVGLLEQLGPLHPDTLITQLSMAGNEVGLQQPEAAAKRLLDMEKHLLTWLGTELHTTASAAARRGLVFSQANYQFFAISLALRYPDFEPAQELAALAALRFKGVQAEEEALLARLARRGREPEAAKLAAEIAANRSRLSRAFHEGGEDIDSLKDVLEAKELALAKVSRRYNRSLQVRSASLEELRQSLADDTVLVEFRRYEPFEFERLESGLPRWAAIVIARSDVLKVVDLGLVGPTLPLIRSLLGSDDTTAAQPLYDRLVAPIARWIVNRETVILAPDGDLHLVPFHRLADPDGRLWAERDQLVRVVQTGRDLIRPSSSEGGGGLLALGGVDFTAGEKPAPVGQGHDESDPFLSRGQAEALRASTGEIFRGGFKALKESKEEVESIWRRFRIIHRNEPAVMWTERKASEARLKALESPPRVLHLATHGFYRPRVRPTERPMLLSGVALAGANQALKGDVEDGVLYALEAQGLNLEGTELVVLSACKTAQGEIDHSEGVYGLVRAFRTAGARNVLVSLRPVGDASARRFMDRFYRHWLEETPDDLTRALRETQRDYLDEGNRKDWVPFVLIGTGTSS